MEKSIEDTRYAISETNLEYVYNKYSHVLIIDQSPVFLGEIQTKFMNRFVNNKFPMEVRYGW